MICSNRRWGMRGKAPYPCVGDSPKCVQTTNPWVPARASAQSPWRPTSQRCSRRGTPRARLHCRHQSALSYTHGRAGNDISEAQQLNLRSSTHVPTSSHALFGVRRRKRRHSGRRAVAQNNLELFASHQQELGLCQKPGTGQICGCRSSTWCCAGRLRRRLGFERRRRIKERHRTRQSSDGQSTLLELRPARKQYGKRDRSDSHEMRVRWHVLEIDSPTSAAEAVCAGSVGFHRLLRVTVRTRHHL
jgi:hypothetical protein